MCKTAYKVFAIMKACNFMNLYIYQIFSPFHAGRDNLGHDSNLDPNLIGKDMRSWGCSRAGVNFSELISEILFIMDKIFILREFNQLQTVTR